jgi:hypothetical protein
VDVIAGKLVAGSGIQLWGCNSGAGQQWTPTATGSLRNIKSGLCLTPAGGATTPGTALQLATCTADPNQTWQLPR